jgi:hypothetical protein
VNGAAPGTDRLDLLGYDTADADLLPGSFTPGDPQAELAFAIEGIDIDLVRISSLAFLIRGNDSNLVDELRIGTSYASVSGVPEPATISALGLGLAALGVCGRRRGTGWQPAR